MRCIFAGSYSRLILTSLPLLYFGCCRSSPDDADAVVPAGPSLWATQQVVQVAQNLTSPAGGRVRVVGWPVRAGRHPSAPRRALFLSGRLRRGNMHACSICTAAAVQICILWAGRRESENALFFCRPGREGEGHGQLGGQAAVVQVGTAQLAGLFTAGLRRRRGG